MRAALILLTIVGLAAACGGSQNLEGTSWDLMSMSDRTIVTGSSVTLNFTNSEARGSGGCNEYFGSYETDGSSITFGPLGATRMACGEALDQQESAYFSALQQAETFHMTADELEIEYPGGNLTFSASS